MRSFEVALSEKGKYPPHTRHIPATFGKVKGIFFRNGTRRLETFLF